MKIKDNLQTEYDAYKKLNSDDPYSEAIVLYSERWANLMEAQLAQGAALEDIANDASNKADTDGISGYMYGAAVAALSHFWQHGEDLRKWHNKEYGYEGDGTVNPAIVTVEV